MQKCFVLFYFIFHEPIISLKRLGFVTFDCETATDLAREAFRTHEKTYKNSMRRRKQEGVEVNKNA